MLEGENGTGFVDGLRKIVSQSSQIEVATRSGISQSSISRMLRGQRMGNMRTVVRILEAYPELRHFFVSENIPKSV